MPDCCPPPADADSSAAILALAEAYRAAALQLVAAAAPKRPLALAPIRLTALHAIELYINAFLLERGLAAAALRRLQHDFAARAALATAHGLVLRRRTAAHLDFVASRHEYVAARYAPGRMPELSQLNRLTATLEEIARKVGIEVEKAARSAKAAPAAATVGEKPVPPQPPRAASSISRAPAVRYPPSEAIETRPKPSAA